MKVKEQTVHIGENSQHHLAKLFESEKPLRIFAVLDQQAYLHSGADHQFDDLLRQHETVRFFDFEPNPKLDAVIRGIESYRLSQAEWVLAIGGGTAIDMAKLIRALTFSSDPEAVIRGTCPVTPSPVRFVAIPTTAGTGSEATQFAVVYVAGEKFSLDHESIRPDVALIDPKLMQTLPKSVTAATGLDAFCQAVESIWAVQATDESVIYAIEAATLAWKYLVRATHHPDHESRSAMCRAAYLAGKAINISRTTAPHALSYPVTSRFGIPHGIAVSLTLAPLLAYNSQVTLSDCADPRGPDSVQQRMSQILQILSTPNVQAACDRITSWLSELGVPTSLSEAGVGSPEALRFVIEAVNLQRLSNNPRKATFQSLFNLLSAKTTK